MDKEGLLTSRVLLGEIILPSDRFCFRCGKKMRKHNSIVVRYSQNTGQPYIERLVCHYRCGLLCLPWFKSVYSFDKKKWI